MPGQLQNDSCQPIHGHLTISRVKEAMVLRASQEGISYSVNNTAKCSEQDTERLRFTSAYTPVCRDAIKWSHKTIPVYREQSRETFSTKWLSSLFFLAISLLRVRTILYMTILVHWALSALPPPTAHSQSSENIALSSIEAKAGVKDFLTSSLWI